MAGTMAEPNFQLTDLFAGAKFFDISPMIDSTLAVWPKDIPYRRQIQCALVSGANIDLSSIESTLHLGAHADAPSHYLAGGRTIEQVPPETYIGSAQLIEVTTKKGQRIQPEDLKQAVQAKRILLRTNSYPDPKIFNEDFCALSANLITHLHNKGVILVGIDTPSVDPFSDKILQSHQALAKYGMLNLEGLVLANLPTGFYQLVAVPLKFKDADASPVRAILIELKK